MLQEALQLYGAKNWIFIATLVPGRSSIQCNRRWQYALCGQKAKPAS
jgi:hypothetical protein